MKVLDLYYKIMTRLGDLANKRLVITDGNTETHEYENGEFVLRLCQNGTAFDVMVIPTSHRQADVPPRIRFSMRLDGAYDGSIGGGIDTDRHKEHLAPFVHVLPAMLPSQTSQLLPFDAVEKGALALVDAFLHDELSDQNKVDWETLTEDEKEAWAQKLDAHCHAVQQALENTDT